MSYIKNRYFLFFTLFIVFSGTAKASDYQNEKEELNDVTINSEGRWDKSTRIVQQSLFQIEDLKDIVKYPYEHSENTLYFLGGLGALILFDKQITSFYQDKIEPVFAGYKLKLPEKLKEYTGPLQVSDEGGLFVAGIASSYVLGVGLNDDKMQQSALLAGKAITYSYVLSHVVLKSLIARKRPVTNISSGQGETRNYTTNPYAFGYYHTPGLGTLQYGTSMPSFHFTAFFSAAKVYQKVYDNYWLPYSIIALGLTSNIKAHRHWVSDMVAGAVIGTLIGDVVTDYALQEKGESMMILPSISDKEAGINLSYQF